MFKRALRNITSNLLLWFSLAAAIVCTMPYAKGDTISLALENADIEELIRWAGQQTDKNIILHPAVKGKVTVLAGGPLSPNEAYAVFVSTLQVHGFAIVDSGEAIKVVPSSEATLLYAPMEGAGEAGNFDDIVVRVFRAMHIPTEQLIDLARPLLTESAFLNAPGNSSVIVVGDRRGNIDRVMQIIAEVDQGGVSEIRRVTLSFASVGDVVKQMRLLLPKLFEQSVDQQSITVVPIARTNTIMFSGPPSLLGDLVALAKELDQPLAINSQTQVVDVQYMEADELVAPLLGVAASLQQLQSATPAQKGEVSINVSQSNNALIITAPDDILLSLRSIIHSLDMRRTQVLVEAIIVEINADKMMELGITWRNSVPDGDGVFGGVQLPGGLATPTPPALGGGLTLGFFNSGELQGVLRTLATDADTNFLSTPTIVTLDNQEAEILVGENIPLITGSSTSSSSPTDNPFQTIQRQDIGVSLKVKPRVNNENAMTLQVSQTVETISPSTVFASDIVTSKRQITTTVLIEDNEVLVLGGLIRDDVTTQVQKVPVLGDIPLIKHAFRSTKDEVVKRNLMVFLHPRILDNRSDNHAVTGHYRETIERSRQEFLDNNKRILFPKTLPPVISREEDQAVPSAIDLDAPQ